jgi:hypothetical protein
MQPHSLAGEATKNVLHFCHGVACVPRCRKKWPTS